MGHVGRGGGAHGWSGLQCSSGFLVGYGDLVRHSAWCILYRCILGILYYTVLHIVCVNA